MSPTENTMQKEEEGDQVKYSIDEIMQYVREEDVKFIKLAFCDVFGKQKNISIPAEQLPRAFGQGIAIDASSVAGFGDEVCSDLFLRPDPETIKPLPWRPEHGRVVRMMCSVICPDGTPFACDTRAILQQAVKDAKEQGITFSFGAEQKFYLFDLDADDRPGRPYDRAGYMDIAPEDKGENVRREICLTLEQMGLHPESSHHEHGPGQNEIDFRFADPLTAADDVLTFQTVVRTIAFRYGLYADFSPVPLDGEPGNSFHVNISARSASGEDICGRMIAGILARIREMTVFCDPEDASYTRLGQNKAPRYISWAPGNRSQLIRIPAAGADELRRIELRSPDPSANPYLVFALLIRACLCGISSGLECPEAADVNLYTADERTLAGLQRLPSGYQEAAKAAAESDFIRESLPQAIIDSYCGR